MARPSDKAPTGYVPFPVPRPAFLNAGGYLGPRYISVNTRLPSNPRLVDRSKLPNGSTAADYNHLFSKLPIELDDVLRKQGHVEVSLTIDERGKTTGINNGSRSAAHATYIGAMIRRNSDNTNELVGIWGGRAGGGNNGAPAALVTSKLMSTKQGRLALQANPILDAATMNWQAAQLANTGTLNRDPHGWEFKDGGQTTFVPYTQNQTYGVHKQSSLGEHHSKHDTWGCLSGSEESFRARINSRMVIMMGKYPDHPHDWGNGMGIQNTATVAAHVFIRNKDVAANTLGKIYHLNPLMFETANPKYRALAQELRMPSAAPTAFVRYEALPAKDWSIKDNAPAATTAWVVPKPRVGAHAKFELRN